MGILEPEPPHEEGLEAELRFMGSLIARLREERGMSREELAAKCEVTVPELEAIESGDPEERWGGYRKIAEALAIPFSAFLRAVEERTAPGTRSDAEGGKQT